MPSRAQIFFVCGTQSATLELQHLLSLNVKTPAGEQPGAPPFLPLTSLAGSNHDLRQLKLLKRLHIPQKSLL